MKPPIEFRPKWAKPKPDTAPKIDLHLDKAVIPASKAKANFDRTAYQREYMRKRRAKAKIT